MAAKPRMTGKYTKEADEKMDDYLQKKAGITRKEHAKYEKMDKAHVKKKKPKTLQEDKKVDKKILKKIVSERPKGKAVGKKHK
jgi:hypothetical protein